VKGRREKLDDAGETGADPIFVPHLSLARALPGAQRLQGNDSGVNPTYVGLVDTGIQNIRAYIKVLTRRQLVNEIISAQLGHALKLPMPKAFLVIGNPADGYGDPAPQWLAGPDRLLFASEAAPSGVWRPPSAMSPYPTKPIVHWQHLPVTVCFDDWIANVDRHHGNLLFDGKDNFLLIDHSHAFSGCDWNEESLVSAKVFRNKLIDCWPGKMLGTDARLRICEEVTRHAAAFAELDLGFLICEPLKALLSASEVTALEAFLKERPNHVAASLPGRLGIQRLVQ
jgi:hypothetical protein